MSRKEIFCVVAIGSALAFLLLSYIGLHPKPSMISDWSFASAWTLFLHWFFNRSAA